MGYACPVCETPQADATHLANHLAFTALIRGGEHETWLDERCPGWEAAGEAALADRVAERVDPDPQSGPGPGPGRPDERASGERPEVREAEPVRSRAEERPIGGPPSAAVPGAGGENDGDGDGDGDGNEGATEDVLERARELTRRRRADRDDAMDEDGDSPQADE